MVSYGSASAPGAGGTRGPGAAAVPAGERQGGHGDLAGCAR